MKKILVVVTLSVLMLFTSMEASAKVKVAIKNASVNASGGIVVTIQQSVDWSKACFGYIKTHDIFKGKTKKWHLKKGCKYSITGLGNIKQFRAKTDRGYRLYGVIDGSMTGFTTFVERDDSVLN